MSDHLTRPSRRSQSQRLPIPPVKVASDVTLPYTYVMLCDWHGRVIWKSGTGDRLQVGDELWKAVHARSRERLRTAVAKVVTLREQQNLEVEGESRDHFRLWMWPLNEPDIAVCVLATHIPSELALLTEKEKTCLRGLAQGHTTRDIARELKIGLTTVHTHLRRSREKLGLTSVEALISFAARYFFVPPPPDLTTATASRKRTG